MPNYRSVKEENDFRTAKGFRVEGFVGRLLLLVARSDPDH